MVPHTCQGKTKYVNITQIFDEGMADTVMECERYMKALVKNKQFWNREVLKFLNLPTKAVKHFLLEHQKLIKM